ncbi:MAG: hypothetical protein GTO14_20425 [Anaerolineales bacterium]|nr:hypothetical protein [Anaerolineales bacterium]
MLALVMSGAANYGSMQAGALEILFDAGFRPEMVVGTSAGALNAIYMAMNPSPEGVLRLQDIWRATSQKEVGTPTPIGVMRRLVRRRESLVTNDPLAAFLNANLPEGLATFEQLKAHAGILAYAVAVCVETGDLRVFGDHATDRLEDGAMASTAVPPYFPPWEVGAYRYLDGGVYTKLPMRVAIERGATQILALDVTHLMGSKETAQGILGLSAYAVSLMLEAQVAREIAWSKATRASVRVIRLNAPVDIAFWDYTQAERLIHIGREIATEQLKADPIRFSPQSLIRIRRRLMNLVLKVDQLYPFR